MDLLSWVWIIGWVVTSFMLIFCIKSQYSGLLMFIGIAIWPLLIVFIILDYFHGRR